MRFHGALRILVSLSSAVLSLLSPAVQAGETTFDVPRNGFTLKGVLDTPEGAGPFPLVLILPGSGPTDADGNSHLPPGDTRGLHDDIYKQLATRLTSSGYAVARINKRGLPPSTGDGNNVSEQDYADDYLATLDVLRHTALIDGKRVVIAGHSEGGPIAMLMAPSATAAAFIFLESPGEPMTTVVLDQILTNQRSHGVSSDQIDRLRKYQTGFYSALVEALDDKPFEYRGKAFSSAQVRYYKSLFGMDASKLATQVKAPSLVIQGTQDFNVAPENGKLLAAALPNSTLVMIDDMSHVLTIAKTRDPMQLDVPAGTPLHPKIIPAIVDWLQKTVPASR